MLREENKPKSIHRFLSFACDIAGCLLASFILPQRKLYQIKLSSLARDFLVSSKSEKTKTILCSAVMVVVAHCYARAKRFIFHFITKYCARTSYNNPPPGSLTPNAPSARPTQRDSDQAWPTIKIRRTRTHKKCQQQPGQPNNNNNNQKKLPITI